VVQGQSSYYVDDANAVSVPGYVVATVTLRTERPFRLGGSWGVGGFVTLNNAFDRPYIGSAFLNPEYVGSDPVAFEPGLPRNLMIGLSVEAGY
jgi:outer membrane receptor protein involved in Fe transport